MWKDAIKDVEKVISLFNKEINEGATKKEIDVVCKNAKKDLGMEVPSEYIDFLKEVNGFEFNGFILYNVDEELLEKRPKQKCINGLIDSNKVWYENEWDEQYFFLGESSMSWFVYDIKKEKYAELDNPSGEVSKYYEDFDSMLVEIFEASIR